MSEYSQSGLPQKKLAPKTALGFYAVILGLTLTACTSIIGALAATGTDIWMIPYIVLFACIFLLAISIGVFVVTLKNPSKMLLTEVSGRDYMDIQRWMLLGDSKSGLKFVSDRIGSGQPNALEGPVGLNELTDAAKEKENG